MYTYSNYDLVSNLQKEHVTLMSQLCLIKKSLITSIDTHLDNHPYKASILHYLNDGFYKLEELSKKQNINLLQSYAEYTNNNQKQYADININFNKLVIKINEVQRQLFFYKSFIESTSNSYKTSIIWLQDQSKQFEDKIIFLINILQSCLMFLDGYNLSISKTEIVSINDLLKEKNYSKILDVIDRANSIEIINEIIKFIQQLKCKHELKFYHDKIDFKFSLDDALALSNQNSIFCISKVGLVIIIVIQLIIILGLYTRKNKLAIKTPKK